MIRIPIGGAINPAQLLSELMAVPSLRPRERPGIMPDLTHEAVTSISGNELHLPDDADLQAVARIVAAHTPHTSDTN